MGLNKLFGAGISDAHCGMRAIKKDTLDDLHLKSGGMEFASEMVIEAARKNVKIAEIPITYYPREGESKLSSFADGWRHLKIYDALQTNTIPSWTGINCVDCWYNININCCITGRF